MNKFQLKTKDYKTKRIDDEKILELTKEYKQEIDYPFLVSEFKENYNINQYYTRNLFEIIEKLIEAEKFIDSDNFCDFLENKLKELETLSSLNRDIFIKLYLKLTKNTDNVKKLFDEYIRKKYINVSTIEDFNEYFININGEELYFIKSFLYDKEGWFRLHFFDYKTGIKHESQQKILNFSKENLELFFIELSKEKNIGNLLHELFEDKENKFINELTEKTINYNLENLLYYFLIGQIKFTGKFNDYYSKNAFYKRNIVLFNILKKEGFLNYQQFFKDINYGQPGYHYYREFENFVFLTIESKTDLENLIKVKEIEEKEYFIRNGYFNIRYRLNNENILKIFIETIPEKIDLFEEENKRAIERNKKYEDENEKKILDEIKEHLDSVKDEEKKLFSGFFVEDFIKKYEYQLRLENENTIQELAKNQINYFFTWENININKDEILSKFIKTETGYNAPNFLFDGTFELIFKSAKKIGFDLSIYKNKLAGFYPFQGDGEILDELKKYFGIEEIKIIIDIYKNYPAIRGFQNYNIIGLFKNETYNYNNFLEEVKQNNTLKEDLIFILKELNNDENFNKYYLKESLELLNELGVENNYYKSLKIVKPVKNYFTDILKNEV